MKLRTVLLLVASHAAVAALGFSGGIYVLPLLTAPTAPSLADVKAASTHARFTAQFRRDLKGSDALHWGEGQVAITRDVVTLAGNLAPGPDYKLYLSPEFVETEADFLRLKSRMVRVGDVKTFRNFMVPLPPGVDPAQFSAVIVWCETFGQFITAAKYQ